MYDTSNLARAKAEMQLSPQEENLYYHHLNNLNGTGKVMNPDGSISTIYSTTVGLNGRHYTLPTVWEGKILEPDAAIDKAIATGLHKFPSYPTPEAAMTRYQQMHDYMDQDVKQFLKRKK